jgi:hypothetical protein
MEMARGIEGKLWAALTGLIVGAGDLCATREERRP